MRSAVPCRAMQCSAAVTVAVAVAVRCSTQSGQVRQLNSALDTSPRSVFGMWDVVFCVCGFGCSCFGNLPSQSRVLFSLVFVCCLRFVRSIPNRARRRPQHGGCCGGSGRCVVCVVFSLCCCRRRVDVSNCPVQLCVHGDGPTVSFLWSSNLTCHSLQHDMQQCSRTHTTPHTHTHTHTHRHTPSLSHTHTHTFSAPLSCVTTARHHLPHHPPCVPRTPPPTHPSQTPAPPPATAFPPS